MRSSGASTSTPRGPTPSRWRLRRNDWEARMIGQHLAQLNIGRLRYDLDDPRLADFIDNLARVNAIAERSEGFVWRLKDETGNATNIRAFDDPRMAVN